MKLRVLFFSVLRDITGTDEIVLELPAGSTMAICCFKSNPAGPSCATGKTACSSPSIKPM
jgi:hypothetical protein